MSYFDSEKKELMIAVLSNDEYPCLPLYECVEDQNIVDEVNLTVLKINNEKEKTQKMILRLLEVIEKLENDNEELRKSR
tara:strand:+ start:193 stop:429 length:237 start_codon:yes stop_codon:yes gene_type:complete